MDTDKLTAPSGEVIRPAAWGQPSTQPSASSRAVAFPGDEPAGDREFITILTPCLQLVAGVGMTPDAQDTWFEAARLALANVPLDLLRDGAMHAMATADHPSKIVPAIMASAKPAMDQRRESARRFNEIFRGSDQAPGHHALPAPGDERLTVDEADAICRRYGIGRYSPHAKAERGDAA